MEVPNPYRLSIPAPSPGKPFHTRGVGEMLLNLSLYTPRLTPCVLVISTVMSGANVVERSPCSQKTTSQCIPITARYLDCGPKSGPPLGKTGAPFHKGGG